MMNERTIIYGAVGNTQKEAAALTTESSHYPDILQEGTE
jgi:hypothetical protein